MPCMRRIVPLMAAALLVSVGGCNSMANYGDERKPAAEAAEVQVPVREVRSVEIGRTRNGFLITAYGVAPGLGYARPTLRPRRDGAPGIDGYLEYDFVASEPPPGFGLPEGTPQARALRADLPVDGSALRGVAGLRVLGLSGAAQISFAPPSQAKQPRP